MNGLVKLCHRLLSLLQLSPDNEVEQGEDEEGTKGGHGDPGPGAVEDDVVPAESELGWADISNLMVTAATASKVHAVVDCLRLKKLSNVEEHGDENTGQDVHHCAGHLGRGQSGTDVQLELSRLLNMWKQENTEGFLLV